MLCDQKFPALSVPVVDGGDIFINLYMNIVPTRLNWPPMCLCIKTFPHLNALTILPGLFFPLTTLLALRGWKNYSRDRRIGFLESVY